MELWANQAATSSILDVTDLRPCTPTSFVRVARALQRISRTLKAETPCRNNRQDRKKINHNSVMVCKLSVAHEKTFSNRGFPRARTVVLVTMFLSQ